MRLARRYLVTGRVQGVGFRYFTQRAAARGGIRGWVRNNPDGSVEIAAEGDAAAVEHFERDIREGPPGARIDNVSFRDDSGDGRHTQFTIR